jgi:2-polyprenyl-3-methyl-5-hydroxy-6-metoxy-1,4-benzoquinol methylase
MHLDAAAGVRLIERCPVGCRNDLVETTIMLPEGPLRRCPSCGQLVSQITAQAYAESMQEFNTPRGTLPTQRTQQRHDVRAAKLFKTVSSLLQTESGRGRLLDIGCSSGALLESARRQGFDVEGVEPAAQAAEYARSTGLTVFQGYLQDACYPAASFDVVTLMEVIEHLPDPNALLKEVWRVLKPNGVFVVGTGNGVGPSSWSERVGDIFTWHSTAAISASLTRTRSGIWRSNADFAWNVLRPGVCRLRISSRPAGRSTACSRSWLRCWRCRLDCVGKGMTCSHF